VDKERERPDHDDKEYVLVGIFEEEGGCEEEDDGAKRQKQEQRKPFLQVFLDFLTFFEIHTMDIN
jgi:hypothetical protein